MNQNSQPYIKKHVYSLLHKTLWASLDFSLQTNSETSGGGYWFDSYPDTDSYTLLVSALPMRVTELDFSVFLVLLPCRAL